MNLITEVCKKVAIIKVSKDSSEGDVFETSGPVHLTHADWKNRDYRRSVAASLVQGVYILERDRQQNRQGDKALAPPWWRSFHFQLIRKLIDDADSSIFGAIYELECPTPDKKYFAPEAPNYVIAFRGTITRNDLKLDLRFLNNRLHRKPRFKIAKQEVQKFVSDNRNSKVWLAGHSLGSAVAMCAGKNMAKNGVFLKTFLFNPPIIAFPCERIKGKRLKKGFRIANSFITATLAVAIKGREKHRSDDYFAKLSEWVPCLFVNLYDHICSEYVGYFEQRKKMEEIGAGSIGRLATQNSIRELVLIAVGIKSESLHLLPSANLTINQSPSPDCMQAHGIKEWWKPDLQLNCMPYVYK